MTDDVFPFMLEVTCRDGRRASVECLGVLRAVKKTRTVYDARWEGRPVIAKLFIKPGKAWYHMKREWRGLEKLKARQLNTPEPLFCGRTPQGWVVVTEKIEGAVTGTDIWTGNGTLEEKTSLLCRIATELAHQHITGVTQTDLHLGNFLIRGEETYILDPAMMHFARNEIGRYRSIRQLALLTAAFSEQAGASLEKVFRHYAGVRNWTIQPEGGKEFRRVHRRCRKSAVGRAIRKFSRANRRHEAIRHGPWSGLAERAFLTTAGINALTAGLGEAMERGSILKRGGTCFVSRTKLGGRDVVIKRYNHKGLLHSLRHTLKGSRAGRNWRNAHRLSLLGITAPMPLAYINERRGPLLWRSYFIMEFVAGPSLCQILQDTTLTDGQKQHWIDETLRLIDRLAEYNVTHGDMKHTNILCSHGKVVLTDLDAVRAHWTRYQRRRRHEKDVARLLRDVDQR